MQEARSFTSSRDKQDASLETSKKNVRKQSSAHLNLATAHELFKPHPYPKLRNLSRASNIYLGTSTEIKTVNMAPSNLPSIFNATSQDMEMLLAAQCHLGSKNLQVHMEPYLWKTRPDGINVINIGKTW